MRNQRIKQLFTVLLITFLAVPGILAAISFDGDINYHGAGGGDINFDFSFDAASVAWSGETIRFTNFNPSGLSISSLGFDAVSPASMNVTEVTHDYIVYKVPSHSGGDGTTRIYAPTKGEPIEVTGDETWSYSSSTDTTTVTTDNSTDQTVTVYFDPDETTDEGGMYVYHFNGPYYEDNGTRADTTTVTAQRSGAADLFTLNGSHTYNNTDDAQFFYWNLTSTSGSRYMYPVENNETYHLFVPEPSEDFSRWTFTIEDLTGKYGLGDAHLESLVTENSTTYILERDLIEGSPHTAHLTLLHETCYTLRIRWADGTYTYFYLCTGDGSDTTETLTAEEAEWGDQTRFISEYIIAEASRPTTTSIEVSYEDTTPGYDTENITFIIMYRNESVVTSFTSLDTDTYSHTWTSADADTDYVVDLEAEHEYFGEITARWILDAQRTFNSFPDLDTFGTWTIPTGNLLALLVAAVLTGTCTFLSAPLAPFLGVTAIAVMTYLGGASYSTEIITLGYFVAIIMGLVLGRRR